MNTERIDPVSFLDDLPERPQLLALGEPMHGSEEVLAMRNTVIEDLVLRGGYRSLAFESDLHAGELVNEYITGGDIDIDRALTDGFSHGFVNARQGTRDLLVRLRDINRTLDQPVRFYGFDGPMEMSAAPSARRFLVRLRAGLADLHENLPASAAEIEALVGDEAAWIEQQAMYDATRSVGRSANADRLRLISDDLLALLDASAPHLARNPECWWWLRADARTAAGLGRYHALMATDVPERLGRLSAQRDAMMAQNLVAVADREAARGGTIVFAHNLHLQRGASEMRMGPHRVTWFSGGALADALLPGRYRHLAIALGAAPVHGLAEPAPGTVEGLLYRDQATNAQLYRGADLADRLHGATARADRDALGAYFPLVPEQLAETDGVLFLREVRA